MTPTGRGWAILAALALCAAPALADGKPSVMGQDNSMFDRIRSLVGEWRGTTAEGKPVTISYTLVSGGTAVMEHIGPGEEADMVTMYYPDGRRLMMTHYCAGNNQPRMRADDMPPDGKKLEFKFVDATNLKSPDMGHMEHLVLKFPDADHLTQEWTWVERGKGGTEVFNLERAR